MCIIIIIIILIFLNLIDYYADQRWVQQQQLQVDGHGSGVIPDVHHYYYYYTSMFCFDWLLCRLEMGSAATASG